MADGFRERSDLGTAGDGQESPVASGDLGDEVYGTGRDVQSDAGRMGAPSQQLEDSGWQCDAGPTTLADEKRADGWKRLAKPVGAEPNPVSTSATRGAADERGGSGLPD